MHKLQVHLNCSISLLLHVSVRLRHPQGVHRPNIKLAGLKQMITIVLISQVIQQPNSAKFAV
jgi:hypothetical protein